MKSILWNIFLMILFLLAILLGESKAQFSGGDGSLGDPFLITTFDDLDTLREDAGLATAGSYFELTNDISMSTATGNWIIVNFTGHINGKGFAIRDWTDLNKSAMNFIATFEINSSLIRLSFINLDWRYETSVGAQASGIFRLVGNGCLIDSVIIDSCNFVNKSIASTSVFPWNSVLMAKASGDQITINRCAIKRTTVEIFREISSGSALNGLFCGQLQNSSLTITNSYIDSVTFYHGETLTTGGVASFFVANTDLSGMDSLIIRDCYILNSFTETRAQSASSDRPVGAFIGLSIADDQIRIENCYASFNVGTKTIGGFVYNFDASDDPPWGIFTSYYDSSKVAMAQITGTHTATSANAETTAQMKLEATYTGFDFVDVWGYDLTLNDSYPFLSWTVLPIPPSGYFHLIDLRTSLDHPVGNNQTMPIGWETNADLIKFDSVSTLYNQDVSGIDFFISDSTSLIIGDIVSVIARGFNVVPVFDSVYSRPVPISDTSDITGTGTLSDPFVLYHATDIDSTRFFGAGEGVRDLGAYGPYYALGSDIDMSVYPNWSDHLLYRWSRNNAQVPNFGRGIDGRGYKISGLRMTVESNGGPSTFINLSKHSDSRSHYVKNIIFEDCSLSVTGNPASQMSQNVYLFRDKFEVNFDNTVIAFIESNDSVDNVIFIDCDISVVLDTLWTYTNIAYIYKPNSFGPDILSRIGLESCSLTVDIDFINIFQHLPYRGFHISMLSATEEFANSGFNWIDDDCSMIIDIGEFLNKDISQPLTTNRLFVGSVASGNGGRMYDTYVGGTYNWTIDPTFFGPTSDPAFKFGHYGLLSGTLPVGTNYSVVKDYMKRNLFNGNLITNVDTITGVTYKSISGALANVGSSYYNSDSVSAIISNSFNMYRSNLLGKRLLGVASDSNGLSTAELKMNSTYEYPIFRSRFVEDPIVNQWGFTYGNWRKNDLNNSYPHIYGQNNFADTNFIASIIDTAGIDTLNNFIAAGACRIIRFIDIDTVSYIQNDLSQNDLSIVVRTSSLDSIDLYYSNPSIDTLYRSLGRVKIDVNRQGFFWDTTTFVYDVTLSGIDATKPIIIRASVDGIFPTIDDFKDTDIQTFTALPNRLICTEYNMFFDPDGISWAWIQDVTCGWVPGSRLATKGQGSFGGVYILSEDTLITSSYRISKRDTIDFISSFPRCRPKGTRGYNLKWDLWLCQQNPPVDTISTEFEYESCYVVMKYFLEGGKLKFVSDINNDTVTVINYQKTFPIASDWNLSIGSNLVGYLGALKGLGHMIAFRMMTINAALDPADDIYAFGAPDGIGTALALGNTRRDFFRGIHPKIFKWGSPTAIKPDSIFIMTPDGPVKVKL